MALSGFAAEDANAISADKEKCYGVAKAGKNDCGNAEKTHSCAGHAATDGEGGEWVAVPQGLCDKLVGGSLTPIAADAHSCEGKDGCEGKTGCEGKSGCEGKNGCEGK